jgi:hypothetical protein
LLAALVATLIIVGLALLVDVLYAWHVLPMHYVQSKPVLLYANGEPSLGLVA